MENVRKSSRADIERYNLEILLRRPSLRASVPRRVSQVRQETATTPDTTCGSGCIRGQWLQSFANRTSFIFAYEVFGSFYASYVAYFYGTIATLEKRFKFSNRDAGIIAASGDLSKVVVCLLLSLVPLKVKKLRCLGVGVFLIILSSVLFTIPRVLYGPGLNEWHGNSTHLKNENCTKPYRTCSKPTEENNAFLLFLLTQILHGIGGGLYLTYGKSYKDENIHLQQSPSLISLLSILKTLGPAFGYWLSSVCLKTHESLEKATNEDESHWIGAWWLGNLVIGFILSVVGLLLVSFPPTLPKAAVRRIFNNVARGAELRTNLTNGGLAKKFKRLFTNSALNSTRFSGTFTVVGFLAYFLFLPKYVEIQYRVTASVASLTTGSITLISAAFGIVMASSVITRYRPNARALAAWTIIVGVLSTGGLISYTYLGCAENDAQIKAIAMQYPKSNNSCECGFHTICVKSETVPSPCHTECSEFSHNNTKVYKNCNETIHNNKGLTKGFCSVDCYSSFLLFIIVTCSITFIYATGQISNFWFEKNHPDNKHESHSSGLHIINIFLFIPAPIIFGYILDNACILWDDNCSNEGNCWLYDNENLRYVMNTTAIGFSIIGIIFDVHVWFSVKNLILFHDDDDNGNDDDEYTDKNDET